MRKIGRFNRTVIITEKLDGTNASVHISEDGGFLTASRNRWITPEADNCGFSKWAHENKEELMKLGVGAHFGEWWGCGIQRNYGLSERRFSLFNASKWKDSNPAYTGLESVPAPQCCHVVPVLDVGMLESGIVERCLTHLRQTGSAAAGGFRNPEGIVIYHTANGVPFKVTLEDDKQAKGNR